MWRFIAAIIALHLAAAFHILPGSKTEVSKRDFHGSLPVQNLPQRSKQSNFNDGNFPTVFLRSVKAAKHAPTGKKRVKRGEIKLNFGSRTTRWFGPSIFGGSFYSTLICDRDARPCPEWTKWTGYDVCSVSCGGGYRFLRRYCEYKERGNGCTGSDKKFEECNTHECPSWSVWAETGECSKSCGQGHRLLTRRCTLRSKESDKCFGAKSKLSLCSASVSCPAQWSEWSVFNKCSSSCGSDGIQHRSRYCIHDNTNNTRCVGESTSSRSCNIDKKCPSKFSSWSDWSDCNITCGAWSQIERRRICLVDPCSPESLVEKKLCLPYNCGNLKQKENKDTEEINKMTSSEWSGWSVCSSSCGEEGIQIRSRNCSVQVHSNMTICNDNSSEYRRCRSLSSCPTWDKWSSWSSCGEICGVLANRTRQRYCVVKRYSVNPRDNNLPIRQNNSFPLAGENPKIISFFQNLNKLNDKNISTREDDWMNSFNTTLPMPVLRTTRLGFVAFIEEVVSMDMCEGGFEMSYQTEICLEEFCTPQWNPWSSWSGCSSTCGEGVRFSERSCKTSNSTSKQCNGKSIKYQQCFSSPCWTKWTPYSPCTTSCGATGIKKRKRECYGITSTNPLFSRCFGNSTEIRRCNSHECPRWGSWGAYSPCSATCGGGEKRKSRSCEQGACKGENKITKGCNFNPCPVWSEWTLFTCCSSTCGAGVKNRTRVCKYGNPDDCPGNTSESRVCDAGACNITHPTINSHQCGRRHETRAAKAIFPSLLKIFGGKVAAKYNWPWQVSLQEQKCDKATSLCEWHHQCGGTLITPEWVVSAAHCTTFAKNLRFDEPVGWRIVAGTNQLNTRNTGNEIEIKRIILHPKYRHYGYVLINDIMLIKLARKLDLGPAVAPICISEMTAPSSEESCFITGWGHTETQASSQHKLREAPIPLLDYQSCRNLGKKYKYYLSKNHHICAGDPQTANVDTCHGDSGGPLVCKRSDGSWNLVGITSFSFSHCGARKHAGVYAPAYRYVRWIERTLREYAHGGC